MFAHNQLGKAKDKVEFYKLYDVNTSKLVTELWKSLGRRRECLVLDNEMT